MPACEVLEARLVLSSIGPLAQPPVLTMNVGPVDASLLALAKPPDANAPGVGLPSSLMAYDDAGRVGVTISATDPQGLVQPLQGLGAWVSGFNQHLGMLDAFVPINRLTDLATLSAHGMLSARAMGRPQTGAGIANSQGNAVLEADRLRSVNGLSGSGVNVGVLSDSFNRLGGYATDISTGDLPNNVNVLLEGPASGVGDEGRAMSQIVYDLAPGSGLAFASAFWGQTAFGQSIKDLANPTIGNSKVINDDIFYFAEPFYQNGVIGQAIDTVTSQGVVYASLAGNLGSNAYENVSPTWTTDPVYTGNGVNFLNFGTAASPTSRQRVTLAPYQSFIITLEWDNPFYNAAAGTSNLGLYVASPGGGILGGANVNTLGSGQPYQTLGFQNPSSSSQSYDLIIFANGQPTPGRVKWVNFGANNYGPVTINTAAVAGMSTIAAPTVISHGAASNAVSVAAAPYFNQTVPESYSSFGPMTILFSPDGMTRLPTPTIAAKPDVTAVDGVRTTFFPSPANPYFFGTSAATPHAAAIAALYLQANPSATPAQVKAALIASARPMQVNANNPTPLASVNQVGAGLIDAFRAVNGSPTRASLDVADNFDLKNGLTNVWGTSNRFTGQTQVTGTVGTVGPISTPNQLVLSEIDNVFSTGAVSEANLYLAAPSTSNGNDVGISFGASAIGGLPGGFGMPASFSGFISATGVAISADGQNWYRVSDLSNAATSYSLSRLNISQIAASAGISLAAGFQLRFQGVFLTTTPNQGLAFDNVRVTRLQAAGPATALSSFAGDTTGSVATLASFGDGINPVGSYSASINWGDASNSAGAVSVVGNQIVVATTGHVYATGGNYTYTVTLTDNATGRTTTTTGQAAVAADVSPRFSVHRSGLYYSRAAGVYSGTITITNTGNDPITGSALNFAFTGLSGVTLDPSLAGYGMSPSGIAYLAIPLNSPLQPGQAITFSVRFLSRTPMAINYLPKLFLFS